MRCNAFIAVVLTSILIGCSDHVQPREPSDRLPTRAAVDTPSLQGLDSISRAALQMMQTYFRVLDSAMQYDPSEPDCLGVPVIDLQDLRIDSKRLEAGKKKVGP